MRGTKIAIRLEHAEIDGDAGVIHVDALDAVQALYEAGVCGSANEMDCEMADDIRALMDQLASSQDKCETWRYNPPLYKCGEADFCCMTCAHRRSCLCVECGRDGVNHWAWKGRDDGRTTLENVPTESVEQQCLFRWASYAVCRLPELALMFHIPNGGTRTKSEAGRFRAEGVKAGVPDIFLPAPRGGYAGLFVEMKRRKNGRVSIDQATWLKALEKQGYKAIVAHGWEEARNEIERYLRCSDKST